MPNLSVIIPVYNTEKYLRACIDSVINQTLSDLEIICINDCSSDKSLQILQEYAKKDNRIKIIDFKSNKGVSAARNAGISESTGEYIGFVDSDDYVDLDFFEKLYNKANTSGAQIVKGNVKIYQNNVLQQSSHINIEHIKENKANFIHHWSAIYERNFIIDNSIFFPEGIKRCEDSYFECKASVLCNFIETVDNSSYNYILREDSVNNNKIINIDDLKNLEEAQELIFEFLNSQNVDLETYKIIAQRRYKYLTIYTKDKILAPDAQEYLLKAEKNLKQKIKYTELLPYLEANARKKIVAVLMQNSIIKNKETKIPIFLSSDNNYAPYVATAMASILYNTKDFCEFYILDGGITSENKEKICKLKNKFDNFSIEFLKIDFNKYFKDFKETERISKAMYSRFLIPYLKPEIDKAIYADVDVIALGDIGEMYKKDLQNYALGAVFEEYAQNKPNDYDKRINLSAKHKYFNSGVLLINCKKWKDKDILQDCLKLYEQYKDTLKCPDQDVLNKYFECNYKILANKYNWINQDYDFFGEPKEQIVIRHFNGPIKPWQVYPDIKENIKISFTMDKNSFWKYAKMTHFYDMLIEQAQYKTDLDLRKFLVFKLMHKRAENGI